MAQIKQIANKTFNQIATKAYTNRHFAYLTSYYLDFKKDSIEPDKGKFSYTIDEQSFQSQTQLLEKVQAQYVDSLLKKEGPIVFYEIQQLPDSTYISGLGEAHVTETGIESHTTYGVPYIKGSALKGLLFSWTKQIEDQALSQELIEKIFGYESEKEDEKDRRGEVVFHDVFFNKFSLQKDIMTPHFQTYYEGNQLSEQISPIPVPFITNKFDETGLGALSLTDESDLDSEDLNILINWLSNALQELGIGAKTAIGHGRFKAEKLTDEKLEIYKRKRKSDKDFFMDKMEGKRAEREEQEALEKIESMSDEEREEYDALLQIKRASTDKQLEDNLIKSKEFIEVSASYPSVSKALYEYYSERNWLKKPSRKMEPKVKRLKEIYRDHHGDE